MKKFFSVEWPAWVFLVLCVTFNIFMGQLRAPKMVKDMPGLLTSSCERFIKDQNEQMEDEYGTKVSVAFVTDFNVGRKTSKEYKEYYWDKLDLGENDALYIFICRDDRIDEIHEYGKKYNKLYKGEYTFKLMNDNFVNDVVDAYHSYAKKDSLEIDSITGTFYHNLEDYFDETTCPRDYDEYLENLNNSGITDSVENVVSGVTGLISKIVSSVAGRIAAIGTFPTIIMIIVIISIIKKKGGGVSNRLG
ncbi:MAG: TPM domain-containing protein [Lachnospiraceae bacterium]|nr:TPM domain-containing protein [Lachnospiraceae bacterium]